MSPDLPHPYRSIWRITWPQMLMMACNFLIGVADVWVCGRIGPEVQAAMGLIVQAMFVFLTVAIAVSNGSVASVTQSLGAGKGLRAARYAGLCLGFGAVAGLAVMVPGLLFREGFLDVLNVPAQVRGQAGDILMVFLLLLPVNYLFLITNAILRAHQLVLLPLASMCLVCMVNAWLDFGLGLGWWHMPDWGYRGVAWATFWSVTGGLGLNLLLMARAGLLTQRILAPWRWIRRAWSYMFKVAWPSGLMQVVWHTGYLVLLSVTGGLPSGGAQALGGFAVGSRIESGIVLPAFAFNLSATILVGHALGTGDPRAARRMGLRIWALGAGLMSLLAIALWPNLASLASVFAPDPAVAEQTVSYLRFNLMAIPFTSTSMILAGALTGAGATMYTLVIFGLTIWGVRLPVAWWLGWHAWGTAEGVWLSMLVSQAVQATILLAVYRLADWPRFSMIKPRSSREQGL